MEQDSKKVLMAGKIALCVLIVVNQLRGDKSYDLMLGFLVIMLAESIQSYQKEKSRTDAAAITGLVFAFAGISLLYICSFF